jgi:putative ABC transport system ATP-binding protein
MALAIDPLIRLDGISKIFHTEEVETHALSRVRLDIRAGEFVAVCGPSGCGKTTLLSLLGLLDSPSEGSYVLAGEPVATLSPVQLPLKYRGLPPAERRAMVHEALDRVGLLHRIHHFPAQLSGGQQQRVAVARAVVGKPLVLLADEPTGNLDSSNGAQVMELLHELHAGGATIVMVTHDPRYVGRAGRNVFLFDGRIVDRPPAELEVA